MMAFEVREFAIQTTEESIVWKFKLGNLNGSQVDFYGEEQCVRSLFHLGRDVCYQIESVIDRKKKKESSKERPIRKLCEKIIKTLNFPLSTFAHNIQEPLENVKAYFKKDKLSNEIKERLICKCRKWVIQSWELPLIEYYNKQET